MSSTEEEDTNLGESFVESDDDIPGLNSTSFLHSIKMRKCPKCKSIIANKLFRRHLGDCNLQNDHIDSDSESSGPGVLPNVDLNESNNLNDQGHVTSENSQNDDIDIEAIENIDEEILEMISQRYQNGDGPDETFVDETFVDESLNESFLNVTDPVNLREHSAIVTWICLFLALWQYSFNITDNAFEYILKFIYGLLTILVSQFNLDSAVLIGFPSSLYLFHKFVNKKECFKKYVVCLKCHMLYKPEDCVQRIQGELMSKKCSHVEFPNHNLPHLRKKCDQELMRSVRIGNNVSLVPYKIYCYKPLLSSFKYLFKRKNFFQLCHSWISRIVNPGIMSDVYDGQIWKDFSNPEKMDFLNHPGRLGLMLNCDWFCPYKHVKTNSIGAIYSVIMNLPRSIRFKKENIILHGLIPNMAKEPPTNTFISPLVDELLVAWNDGFEIQIHDNNVKNIKAAVLCVGCDIPASRKLCGFKAHNANKGCNKCNKSFPGDVTCKNYGGFDTENWTARTDQEHRRQMQDIMNAGTKGDRQKLETDYGTKYSIFAKLPYFDFISMTIIDPMHNLFLGTAKRMIQVWKDEGFITKQNTHLIQERIDSIECSNDVGKLPSKFDDFSFASFTADELKNWTLIFSLFVLKGIVPEEHLKCWRLFVISCVYLCNQVITVEDLTIADDFLLKFCKAFERLYGSDEVTPNIHLHCHLINCVKQYGPIYGFWLFSFERYNGMLERMPTNKKDIEIQLMRRFERDLQAQNIPFPEIFKEEFRPLFEGIQNSVQRGSLGMIGSDVQTLLMSSKKTNYSGPLPWSDLSNIQLKRNPTIYQITPREIECLESMYKSLYPDKNINVPSASFKSLEVVCNGVLYGSVTSRSIRASNVTAYWCGVDGNIQSFDIMYHSARPGKILFFLKHSVVLDGRYVDHVLARVDWFLESGYDGNVIYGKPITLFRDNLFEITGSASFLPVQRIFSKFISAKTNIDGNDTLVVIPRIRHLNI